MNSYLSLEGSYAHHYPTKAFIFIFVDGVEKKKTTRAFDTSHRKMIFLIVLVHCGPMISPYTGTFLYWVPLCSAMKPNSVVEQPTQNLSSSDSFWAFIFYILIHWAKFFSQSGRSLHSINTTLEWVGVF